MSYVTLISVTQSEFNALKTAGTTLDRPIAFFITDAAAGAPNIVFGRQGQTATTAQTSGAVAAGAAGGQVQNNFAATVAPALSNDGTQGYAVGSRWVDTTGQESYIAINVATGAAVWSKTTVGTIAEVSGLQAALDAKAVVGSTAGAALGTAAAGTATTAARSDHVHQAPTPAGIGAEPTITTLTVAKGGTGSGTAAGARTNLGLGNSATLNTGTATGTVATGDHAHSGHVTSVTGTAPIASSGGTTPAISISAATQSAAGSMSIADKTKLDNVATSAAAVATTGTPVMDGIAALGTAATAARSDHVHPSDTSKQASLVSGTNIKTLNSQSILGSGNIAVGASSASVTTRDGGTGGTITTVTTAAGTERVHTFTADGTFVVPAGVSAVRLLVVGGGGGGGTGRYAGDVDGRPGGGGGAGGFRAIAAHTVTPGATIAVTVGAGGAGATGTADTAVGTGGVNGGNSVFDTITAAGGGGGGGHYAALVGGVWDELPNAGGSGGGASNGSATGGAGNTPATTPSQGSAGGGGASGPNSFVGGGGGGAGGAGTAGTGNTGGNGGAGSPSDIRTGVSVTYAGGGGGSSDSSGTAGTGGSGGGGAGGVGTGAGRIGANGTANLGGGGGGSTRGGSGGADAAGGSGGSGIVVVRYLYQSLDTPIYANNAAAIAGGLTMGMLYRSGGDPDTLYVVH